MTFVQSHFKAYLNQISSQCKMIFTLLFTFAAAFQPSGPVCGNCQPQCPKSTPYCVMINNIAGRCTFNTKYAHSCNLINSYQNCHGSGANTTCDSPCKPN
eukprot:NODE_158_length_15065_cov_0.349125.p16 type:complete len:100 gc:universal NODE_158_length_15065_cov_0.349125:8527-8228(-)